MEDPPSLENGHGIANGEEVPDFDAADDFEGEPEVDAAPEPDVDVSAGVEADAAADAELEQQKDTPARALYFVRIPRPVMDDTGVKRAQDDFAAALAKLKKVNLKLATKRTAVQDLRKQKAMGRSLKDGSRDEYEQKLAQLREMGDLRKTSSKKISGIKGGIAGLDVRSEEELDARIKEMEASIATGNLSLREEKDVVKNISKLQLQRPKVKEFSSHSESLAELQSEQTKVRATIQEVESEFHILKAEREQAQKIISDIQAKLVVAERELKEVEEEQQELVRAKNEAAEAIQAARQKNDAVSVDWRENRKLSAQVRDMVESGQVDDARALCEQQVEVWLGRIFQDAAFRKQYTSEWAKQRKYAVAEVLPQSATSPEAVAALKANAAKDAKAAGGGKPSKPAAPVMSGAEKAKALIAACLQEASAEVAQQRAGLLRPRRSDSDAEEEEEAEPPAAAAPVPVKKAPAAAAKPAASSAPRGNVLGSVDVPSVVETEPFVVPSIAAQPASGETEEEQKARIREEQRAKAAEAEERKRRKLEGAEKKRLQAIDAKKRAEEAERVARAAPAPAAEVVEEAAPAPVRVNHGPAKPRYDPILASQKVVSAKRPKESAVKKAPVKKAVAQALALAQEHVVEVGMAALAVLFLIILWVLVRIFRA